MAKTISNADEVADSRDVIARIKELELQQISGIPQHFTTEDDQELADLYALVDDAQASPDWEYGEILIRDSFFEQYAEDLAHESGDSDTDWSRWPYTCIDWAGAAEELQADYINCDWNGVTYWIRA